MAPSPLRVKRRLLVLYGRYRRPFWILHSLWALATGVVVLVLSHERFSLAPWVMLFLAVTWISTFFFTRLAKRVPDSTGARMGQEFASYLTRVIYQETLFFLLPFYFSSATVPSANLFFVALLAALAVLSCLDLVFDDLLRSRPWFGLLFFALVAFASLNFLLPLLFRMRLGVATPLAAAIGLGAALPLVYGHRRDGGRGRDLVEIGAAVALAAALVVPGRFLLPPVPLELAELTIATDVRTDPLEPVAPLGPGELADGAPAGGLVAVARIFAPQQFPARVAIHWRIDAERVRVSRLVTATPHRLGFGVWDRLRHDDGSALPAGRYRVEVRTAGGQLIGRRQLEVGGGG